MYLDIKNKEKSKEILKELVSIINSKAAYADVLVIESSGLVVTKDFATIDISNSGELGIKMRAFDGEKFFETFTTNLDYENLKKAAAKLASEIKAKKSKITIKDEKFEKSFADKPEINSDKIPLKKKVDIVEKTLEFLKKEKHLKNARVIYEEDYTHKIFCSKNRFLVQNLSRVSAICFAMVQSTTGEIRYIYDLEYKPGFEATKNFPKVAKKASEEAKKLIKAKRLAPGKYHCILGGRVSGLLAHESFGHGMESDTVYKGRALSKEWIGKRIAADYVSIVEDPSIKNCRGSFYFDDEGQIATKTYLVKNGIVKDYITDMLSAHKMNVKRTANGRCESFDHKAYARMTVTLFAAGNSSFSNMIKNVKDGIFLYGRGGGMEDPKGWGVQIQGVCAQRIKNGKLVDEYYDDVGITGYLPTILGNIKEVSKEVYIENVGSCGKGHKEWVPVSEGGSYLRIENLDLA
ncbi:TldD/PmbA family protein [Candidatus Woesearchaeota archaeon]|nr:TldD/PmbA family protein [Candidatus Woesearchaeota archaeon]